MFYYSRLQKFISLLLRNGEVFFLKTLCFFLICNIFKRFDGGNKESLRELEIELENQQYQQQVF